MSDDSEDYDYFEAIRGEDGYDDAKRGTEYWDDEQEEDTSSGQESTGSKSSSSSSSSSTGSSSSSSSNSSEQETRTLIREDDTLGPIETLVGPSHPEYGEALTDQEIEQYREKHQETDGDIKEDAPTDENSIREDQRNERIAELEDRKQSLQEIRQQAAENPNQEFIVGEEEVKGSKLEEQLAQRIENTSRIQTAVENPRVTAERNDEGEVMLTHYAEPAVTRPTQEQREMIGRSIEGVSAGEIGMVETTGRVLDTEGDPIRTGEGQIGVDLNEVDKAIEQKEQEEQRRMKAVNQTRSTVSEEMADFVRQEEDLSMPENKKQEEIVEQVMRIRDFEESGAGFTDMERDIAARGQRDIDRAENIVESRDHVSQISRMLDRIESSDKDNFIVDGSEVSKNALEETLRSQKQNISNFIDSQETDNADQMEKNYSDVVNLENKISNAQQFYSKFLPEKQAKGAAQFGWSLIKTSSAVAEGAWEASKVSARTLPGYKQLTQTLEDISGESQEVSEKEIKETAQDLFQGANFFEKGVKNILPLEETVERAQEKGVRTRLDPSPTEFEGTYGRKEVDTFNAGAMIETGVSGEMPVIGTDVLITAAGLPTFFAGATKKVQERGIKEASQEIKNELISGGKQQYEGLKNAEELSAEVLFEGVGILWASPVIPSVITATQPTTATVAEAAGRTTVSQRSFIESELPSSTDLPTGYTGESIRTTGESITEAAQFVDPNQLVQGKRIETAGESIIIDQEGKVSDVEGFLTSKDFDEPVLPEKRNTQPMPENQEGFKPEEIERLQDIHGEDTVQPGAETDPGSGRFKLQRKGTLESSEKGVDITVDIDKLIDSMNKKRKGTLRLAPQETETISPDTPDTSFEQRVSEFDKVNDDIDVIDQDTRFERPTSVESAEETSVDTAETSTPMVNLVPGMEKQEMMNEQLVEETSIGFEENIKEDMIFIFEEETEESTIDQLREIQAIEEVTRTQQQVDEVEVEEPMINPVVNNPVEVENTDPFSTPDIEFDDDRRIIEEPEEEEFEGPGVPDDYMPSLEAQVFDIRAEEAEQDFTGLEVRPIVDEDI